MAARCPLVRLGLEAVFAQQAGFELIQSAPDRDTAVTLTQRETLDVAVIGDDLSERTDHDFVGELVCCGPRPRLLFLSVGNGAKEAFAAAAAEGGIAYLSLDTTPELLREVVTITAEGGCVAVGPPARGRRSHRAAADFLEEEIGAREREILSLAADGHSVAEIGRKMYLAPGTIKVYLDRIYRQFGVSGRSAAVAQGIRRGVIG